MKKQSGFADFGLVILVIALGVGAVVGEHNEKESHKPVVCAIQEGWRGAACEK